MSHPRRFITASLLAVLGIAQAAHAQWWSDHDRRPRKYIGTPWEKPVVYDHEKLDEVRTIANGVVWNGGFPKLDRMYDEFVRDGLRATDGAWFVAALADGLDGAFRADEPLVKQALAQWQTESPQSKLLPVARAMMWQRAAWNARGGAYASQVPDESLLIFRERLQKAAVALKESAEPGKDSPIWYWVALIVAGSSGQPSPLFDAAFEEAVAKFPYYHPLYYTRMNYLLPQWGGSYEEVDRLVQRAVERTRDKDGESFYAWLYLDVAAKHQGDFFADTKVSWPRMKKAFDDMLARYPDPWNKNLYATFACRARDRETTARLLAELGNYARLGTASPGITNESCRRFALGAT